MPEAPNNDGEDILGELGPRTRAEEIEALRTLDPEVRRDVLTRYAALHSYSELARPTSRDAERIAATIGMKRTNFMRLFARVRMHGAASGLVPHRRVRQKASAARDGFQGPAERALAAVLGNEPLASLTDIHRRLRQMLPIKDVPTMSTLRRRVYAARQAGANGAAADALIRSDAVFGRQVALAGTLTNLLVDQGPEYGDDGRRACWIGLLLDVQTRLVIGAGISAHPELALAGAIADTEFFLRTTTIGDASVAREEPETLSLTATTEENVEGDDPIDSAGVVDAGEDDLGWSVPEVLNGRSSRLLFRLLGDRLGAISLRPTRSGRNGSRGAASTLERHRLRVAREVDRWNYLVLCARAAVKPEAGGDVVAGRLRRWSRGRVAHFSAESLHFPGVYANFDNPDVQSAAVHELGADRRG